MIIYEAKDLAFIEPIIALCLCKMGLIESTARKSIKEKRVSSKLVGGSLLTLSGELVRNKYPMQLDMTGCGS
jgi:hypothetical protein